MKRVLAGALTSAVLLISWLSWRRAKLNAKIRGSEVRTSGADKIDGALQGIAPSYNVLPPRETEGRLTKAADEQRAEETTATSPTSDSDYLQSQAECDDVSLVGKNIDGAGPQANHLIDPSD